MASKRTAIGLPLGLAALALLTFGCNKDEETTEATPTAAAATQVVGAPTAAATAAAKAPEAAAKWPQRNANLPILGGITNAPARVTPTPLPAGVTATPAPPAATPPPAAKQQIVFYVDTVTAGAGESPFNVDANLSCARTSAFSRGMRIVWRLSAFDNTGTELQTADMERLMLKLPGGKEATFRYGRHGTAWFWTAVYDVPLDFPLGTLDWSVEAKTKKGLSGEYKEWAVFTPSGSERLLVDGTKTISDSRTTIIN